MLDNIEDVSITRFSQLFIDSLVESIYYTIQYNTISQRYCKAVVC